MGILGSIGKVIGGAGKSKSKTEPWKASQPYLLDTMEAAGSLFDAGRLGGVRPTLGDTTRAGMSSLANLGRGNGISGEAAANLSAFMGAPRFGGEAGYSSMLPGNMQGDVNFMRSQGPSAIGVGGVQGPRGIDVGGVQGPGSFDVSSRLPDGPDSYGRIGANDGIDAVRQNVLEATLPQIAGMFGQGGFSKSTMAQSAAGRAAASALAPYEYDQINRNRQLDMDQFNTEQDRGLNYGLASTGMEAGQFNVDEGRRLGFDVNERNIGLGQANTDMDRRLGFDVNERNIGLGQANADMDRRIGFDVQQNAGDVAQQNANRDVRNSLAFAQDDRLRNQYNTEQDRGFQQFFNQNQQQLQGIGLAPAIGNQQYQDAQSLFGLGQFKDQNKQNRQNYDVNNVNAAANFFLPFGQLGTNSTQTGSPINTIGKLGKTVTGLFDAFG